MGDSVYIDQCTADSFFEAFLIY